MFNRDLLKGKRILVTGGGTGLGKEISLGFAAHGAHVFICGRRPEILEQAAGEIRADRAGRPMRWSPTFAIPTALKR